MVWMECQVEFLVNNFCLLQSLLSALFLSFFDTFDTPATFRHPIKTRSVKIFSEKIDFFGHFRCTNNTRQVGLVRLSQWHPKMSKRKKNKFEPKCQRHNDSSQKRHVCVRTCSWMYGIYVKAHLVTFNVKTHISCGKQFKEHIVWVSFTNLNWSNAFSMESPITQNATSWFSGTFIRRFLSVCFNAWVRRHPSTWFTVHVLHAW